MPQAEKDIESAMEDPEFYEYFVVGASSHITAKVNTEKRCVNGTRFLYHSLSLSNEDQERIALQLRRAVPGQVITLQDCPISVNVTLIDEESTNAKTLQ
jgi:hypothetical protein